MSTLRTNALEGVDAKNSITIVAGAGNITTTNVQEGIANVWSRVDQTGQTSVIVSFNIASITDNGTGDQSYTYTNSMSSSNYPSAVTAMDDVTAVTANSKCRY